MQKQLIIIAAGFFLTYPGAIFSNSINLSTNTIEDKIYKNNAKTNSENIISNADTKYKNNDYKSANIY